MESLSTCSAIPLPEEAAHNRIDSVPTDSENYAYWRTPYVLDRKDAIVIDVSDPGLRIACSRR